MSSFAFINDEEPTESGFSFVTQDSSSQAVASDSAIDATYPNDTAESDGLTLSKIAVMKTGKKKKKSTRVGIFREETVEEEDHGNSIANGSESLASFGSEHAMAIAAEEVSLNEVITHPTILSTEPEPALAELPSMPPPTPPSSTAVIEENFDHQGADCVLDGHDDVQSRNINYCEDKRSIVVETQVTDPEIAAALSVLQSACPDAADSLDVDLISRMMNTSIASLSIILSANEKVRASDLLRESLVSDIETLYSTIRSLQQSIKSLEDQQESYAAQERFDLADHLSVEISNLQLECSTNARKFVDLQNQLKNQTDICKSSKLQLVESFVEFHRHVDSQRELKRVQIESTNELLAHTLEEEDKRISAAIKRSEMERGHYEREQQALEADAAVVEDAIKLEVGDRYEKKVTMEIDLQNLQTEVRSLEERLAALRKEEARMQKALLIEEAAINESRKKYDRQLQRIGDRRQDLSQALAECDGELAVAKAQKAALNDKFTGLRESVRLIDMKLQRNSHDAAIAKRVAEILDTISKTSVRDSLELSLLALKLDDEVLLASALATINYDDSDNLIKVRTELQRQIHALENNGRLASSLSASFETTKGEILQLTESLGRLEAEKKVLAANKKFKEAGIIAKDLKDLAGKKADLEDQSARILDQIISNESSRQMLEQNINSLKNERSALESKWVAALVKINRAWTLEVENLIAQLNELNQQRAENEDSLPSQLLEIALVLLQEELVCLRRIDQEIGKRVASAPIESEHDLSPGSGIDDQTTEEPPVLNAPNSPEDFSPVDAAADCGPDSDALVSEEYLMNLEQEISSLEAEIQAAADDEDYDKASELQDLVDTKKQELQRLKVSPQ